MDIRKAIKLVFLNLVILFLLLVLTEGFSGIILFCMNLQESRSTELAERFHTKYDPELGWVNIPSKHIADFYGTGKEIRINGQGFRSDYDFSIKVPEKKVRIICSGDSFTMGYGVSNKQTWPNILTSYNSAVETVNMGQGGYGLDQIYLWYMRDGTKFDHDVHLVAFIGDDFVRMVRSEMFGYAKPFLKLESGSLVTCNTPVPKISYVFRWFTRNREIVNNLSTVTLLTRFIRKESSSEIKATVEHKEQILEQILLNLERINKAKGSIFVLVWLPNSNNEDFDDIRGGIRQMSRKNDWYFIDLTPEMEKLGKGRGRMFIPDDKALPQFTRFAGHYSEEGNRIIAKALYNKLELIPEISKKLNSSIMRQ